MNNGYVFVIGPYVALAMFAAGILARSLRDGRDGAERKGEPAILAGGKVWRASLALIALTHLLGLLMPRSVLAWNAVPLRLYVLEGSGFLLGGLAVGACAEVLWRHLTSPSSSLRSTLGEAAMIALLFVALGSGIFLQALYRWGSSWGAATLTPYVLSVLQGKPDATLVEEMPFLVRLHVATLFGMVAIFPFTRLGARTVWAMRRAFARIAVPATSLLRRSLESARARVTAFLWPEEDQLDMTWQPAPASQWAPRRSARVPAAGKRTVRSGQAGDVDALYENVTKAR